MDLIRRDFYMPMDYAAAGIGKPSPWTKEIPSRAGWYWWRMGPHGDQDPVCLLITEQALNSPQTHSGEWIGPLEIPR